MTRSAMFFRLISSSLRKRKARIGIALFAIVIGTAVVSGLTTLYYDITVKMSKELRNYGANVVLAPGTGNKANSFTESDLSKAAQAFADQGVQGYAPYLYTIVQVENKRLVTVGTWLDQVKKVSPYWTVTGNWIEDRQDSAGAMVGKTVAQKLQLAVGQEVALKDELTGNERKFIVRGIVKTGSTEDNQIFVNLTQAQQLSGKAGRVNLAYLSVVGKGAELEQQARRVGGQVPGLEARPIKQISRSEGIILEKIRSLVYVVVIVILISTLICVATTQATMVMERRKEIGLKKALGADNRSIVLEFLGEGTVLGIAGGILGLGVGYLLAQVMGHQVFNSSISFRPGVVPLVLAASLVVTGLAGLLPVKMATDVEPAVVLKGE
ncbi:MAG: ABC transporter permease [Clostridia bacterium]|nr:ABC transporter permease [Clostridia bacterium]